MKWVKWALRISFTVAFLGLFVLWAWTRFLLVESADIIGAELHAIRMVVDFYESNEREKALSKARGIEVGVLQYATYRRIYYSIPYCLANYYWYHIDEYRLPPEEEKKFHKYMDDATRQSHSFWRKLEASFVSTCSPWSISKWEPFWMDPYVEEWESWNLDNGAELELLDDVNDKDKGGNRAWHRGWCADQRPDDVGDNSMEGNEAPREKD